MEISNKLNKGGARVLAKTREYKGKTIVVLPPDTGERDLSTWLFA